MNEVFIIGIAGGSGSGKTTLAERIASHFGEQISILRHDDYYKRRDALSMEERTKLNYDHPDAFDSELLIRHLDALRRGEDIDSPIYDYVSHNRSDEVRHVASTKVVIVEGILLFADRELLSRFDMKIYVDTDADVRILRRIKRDVEKRGRSLESVMKQYLDTVKPMHEAFVEPSKKHADLIVPEGGRNAVAFNMMIHQIEHQLKQS